MNPKKTPESPSGKNNLFCKCENPILASSLSILHNKDGLPLLLQVHETAILPGALAESDRAVADIFSCH
jgi:hypothetical protein